MARYLEACQDYQDAAGQFGEEMDDFPPEARPERPRQPLALSLYLQCQRFNCLLVEGALLDQPIELWQPVARAGEVYEAWLEGRRQELQLEATNHAQLRQSLRLGRAF